MKTRLYLILLLIVVAVGFSMASAGATQHRADRDDIPLNNTSIAMQVEIFEGFGVVRVVRYDAGTNLSLDEHSHQAMNRISRTVCSDIDCVPSNDSHNRSGRLGFPDIFRPSSHITQIHSTYFEYRHDHSSPVELNISALEDDEYLLIPSYGSLRIEPPPDTTQRYISGGGAEDYEYSTMAIYRGPRRFNDSEPIIYRNDSSETSSGDGGTSSEKGLPGFSAVVAVAALVVACALTWRGR